MTLEWISVISACTALVASLAGPLVTLTVAKRQIHASVVSANREKWIATLRDTLAELISLLASAVVLRAQRRGTWDKGFGPVAENSAFLDRIERVVVAQSRIRLLLNPHEPESRQLCDAIDAALQRIRSDDSPDAATQADILAITAVAQAILKREWERVKRGT